MFSPCSCCNHHLKLSCLKLILRSLMVFTDIGMMTDMSLEFENDIEHEQRLETCADNIINPETGIIADFSRTNMPEINRVADLDWSEKNPEDIAHLEEQFSYLESYLELFQENPEHMVGLRTEWLLTRCLLAIPNIVQIRKDRKRIWHDIAFMQRFIDSSALNKGNTTEIDKRRAQIQQKNEEIVDLNAKDSIWQIHMSELIGYLEILESKKPGITKQVTSTIFETVKSYCTAVSRDDSEDEYLIDEVESIRYGIAGLRVLINFLKAEQITAYYPQIKTDENGVETCDQDVKEGIDLVIADPESSDMVAIQAKSHGKTLPGSTLPQINATEITQRYVDRLSTSQVPREQKKAAAAQKTLANLTINKQSGNIDTQPHLFWVDVWGLDSGNIDLQTGQYLGRDVRKLNTDDFAMKVRQTMKGGEGHERRA